MGLPIHKSSFSLIPNEKLSFQEIDYEFFFNFDSPHTRKCYARDIKLFFDFLDEHFDDLNSLKSIRRSHVVAYKNYLNGRNYGPKTICRKLAANSSYFSHLMEKQIIDTNPFDSVSRPKQHVMKETNDLTDEEVLMLFKALEEKGKDSVSGPLHQAVIYMLFSTGIRKSELINTKLSDFSIENDYITLRVKAKGGKFLTKVIHPECFKRVEDYLEWMKSINREVLHEDYLFQPTRNPVDKNNLSKQLDPKAVDYIVKKWVKAAGISKRISPHSARATYIGSALESGVDLYRIASDVGHSSVKTTEEYNKRKLRLSDSPVHQIGFLSLKK